VCTDGGRVDSFRATLTSTAPADAASSLPWYVTGGGISGVEPGDVRTVVVLYPPRGGEVGTVRVGGAPTGALVADVFGRRAASLPVTLGPGQTTEVAFTVTSTSPAPAVPGAAGTIDLWTTPTVSAPGLEVVPVAACG
jgi:mRNA-degrading endonuclease toxin of MazEF toxin-antitoxin module